MAWQDYLAKQLRDWGSAGALRVGIAGPKGCRQIRLYTGNHELVDVLIRDIVDD